MGWDGMGWDGMGWMEQQAPLLTLHPRHAAGLLGHCRALPLPLLLPDGFAPARSLTSLFVATQGSMAGLCPQLLAALLQPLPMAIARDSS